MATFFNNRLAARPAERMRGCSWAENFVTKTASEKNDITFSGSGHEVDSGLKLDGNGIADCCVLQLQDKFSATLQFKTSFNVSTATVLMGVLSLSGGSSSTGFCIWLDNDGVNARVGNAALGMSSILNIDTNYADNVTHTVTIVNDNDGVDATYILYYDDDQVSIIETMLSGYPANNSVVKIGESSATQQLIGTVYKPRIFDNVVLTQAEHLNYYNDDAESFINNAVGVYRCNAFDYDYAGKKIWDSTLNKNDMHLGDKTNSDFVPGMRIVSIDRYTEQYYYFDFVNDYISNTPDLDDAYLISTVTQDPHYGYPICTQETDKTFFNKLLTSGGHFGRLYNFVICNGTLTQLQKNFLKYQQLRELHRGRAYLSHNNLCVESVCQLAVFFDADTNVYRDYSENKFDGLAHDVTRTSDGCTFDNSGSVVEYADHESLRIRDGTIVVYGDFSGSVASGTIVNKESVASGNYELTTNGNQITFSGSLIAHTFANNTQIAVTWKYPTATANYKPRFYVDGKFIGEGASNVTTMDATDDGKLSIGNAYGAGENTAYTLKQIGIFSDALTDEEINALYHSAKEIRNITMETGSRLRVRATTSVALSETIDPGGAFQLIDVSVQFSSAPTTSEDIVIASVNGDSDEIEEYDFDPSTSAETDHVFRFDKRFPDNTTVKVTYTNTDTRDIVLNVVYQLDESVV